MKNLWTEQEDDVVRKFWASDRPAHEAESILPGRTLTAVKKRAMKIGCKHRERGPLPMMRGKVLEQIELHAPISSAPLADMFKCSIQQVDVHLRDLREARSIHIASHSRDGVSVTRLWAAGNEPDAARPLTKTQLRTEAKLKKPRRPVQVRDGKVIDNHHRIEIRIAPRRDDLTAALFGSWA